MGNKVSIKKEENKNCYTVSFRHPVIKEKNGKSGLKIHRGCGTNEYEEAELLRNELESLCNMKAFHFLASKKEAKKCFSEKAVDIFYKPIIENSPQENKAENRYYKMAEQFLAAARRVKDEDLYDGAIDQLVSAIDFYLKSLIMRFHLKESLLTLQNYNAVADALKEKVDIDLDPCDLLAISYLKKSREYPDYDYQEVDLKFLERILKVARNVRNEVSRINGFNNIKNKDELNKILEESGVDELVINFGDPFEKDREADGEKFFALFLKDVKKEIMVSCIDKIGGFFCSKWNLDNDDDVLAEVKLSGESYTPDFYFSEYSELKKKHTLLWKRGIGFVA